VFSLISAGYQKKKKEGIFCHWIRSVNIFKGGFGGRGGGGRGGGERSLLLLLAQNWQNYWIPRKIKKRIFRLGSWGAGGVSWSLLTLGTFGFLGFCWYAFSREMSEVFFCCLG
jgi:hypothetical protein